MTSRLLLSLAAAALAVPASASADPRPPAPAHCGGAHVSSAHVAVTDVYANSFVGCTLGVHWAHVYVQTADCHAATSPYCTIGNFEYSCHTRIHSDHTRTVKCSEIYGHGEVTIYWHRR